MIKFSKKLGDLLIQQQLTGYAVAKGTGLPASTISRILNGEASTPRSSTLAELAAFLGMTPSELTEGTELEEKYLPKKGKIVKGLKVPLVPSPSDAFFDSGIGGDVPIGSDFLPPFPFEQNQKRELIAVVMDSDALAPRVRKGDIIYFDTVMQTDKNEYDAKNGDIVLALFEGGAGQALIRQYFVDDLGKRWLTATNPLWPGERSLSCSLVHGVAVGFCGKL